MKFRILNIILFSTLLGFSYQSLAQKGTRNNHPAILLDILNANGISLCTHRPEKSVQATRKTGNFGKAYSDPQGDEGLQIAFSLFISSSPACSDVLFYLADSAFDADPLPHE